FLNRNLPEEGKQRLLRQWAGYCLTRTTELQRCLFMVGDGANGKSVALAVFEAFLGSENCCSVALEDFSDRFRMMQTIDKLTNIVPEVGEIDRVAEGRIKAYVTGELITFEKKYKDPFAARPTARLTLATNTLPLFRDRSRGIWRRIILL